MGRSRPAAGGGRWVEVEPDRLLRWLDGFQSRHGEFRVEPDACLLRLISTDETVAELYPPPGVPLLGDLAGFVPAVQQPRRLGLLLARKAAAAVGVAFGDRLETSKVDSWYVQSRTAAGGTSQQRFARRRGNQAAAAAGKAADIAARLLLPSGALAALVTGGDRGTVETILSDPRLAPLRCRRSERHLDVPTPNLAVLRAAVLRARAVTIHLPPG